MKAKKVNENILLEKFIYEVTPTEVVTNEFIKGLYNDDYMIQSFVIDYLNENQQLIPEDFDPNDEDLIEEFSETDDFKSWLKYELEYKFEELQSQFHELIDDDGYLTIYRSMTVPHDYLRKIKEGKIKRIGHYWTFDKDYAEPHWGYNTNNNEIIFEAKIKENQVNWINTFRLNLEHESINDEHEIRLFKNTPLYIINIEFMENKVEEEIINNINQLNVIA